LGRRPIDARKEAAIRADLREGKAGIMKLAAAHGVGVGTVQRIKVALARALVHDPGNLILDEPTNGLDVMAIRSLRDMLRTLRAEGRCILFSSHVMQEVAALCDRVVIIGHGKVLADATVQSIRDRSGAASLEEAFLQVLGDTQGVS